MNSSCRICLFKIESSNCINIYAVSRNDELISDMIMNFAYVEVFEDDDLSTVICLNCHEKLNSVYDFKDLIVRSDTFLRKQKKICVEVNDEEDDHCNDVDNSSQTEETIFLKCEENNKGTSSRDVVTTNNNDDHIQLQKICVEVNDEEDDHCNDVDNSSQTEETIFLKCEENNKDTSSRDVVTTNNNDDHIQLQKYLEAHINIEQTLENDVIFNKQKETGLDRCDFNSENKFQVEEITLIKDEENFYNTTSGDAVVHENENIFQSQCLKVHDSVEQNKETGAVIQNKKSRIFKCDQCENTFKNRYSLISHQATHTGFHPHSCDVCNKGFLTNWSMKIHRRVHFEDRPCKCEKCGKSFKSPSTLIEHRKIHEGVKLHQCNICGKKFLQLAGLLAHKYTHTKENLIVCEFCGKHYASKHTFEQHLRRIHKDEKPNHPCPVCGKSYAGVIFLRRHMKIHSKDRPLFQYDVCAKQFKNKKSIAIHMRIHEGIKPYSCQVCGKSFTQANCVTRHMRIHTGETPYPCTVCEKSFSYSHHLLKHMKKEHTDKQ